MTQDILDTKTNIPEGKERRSPPYISFLTFSNFITWLESEGVPLKFDRSFWHKKYSGSLGLQLTASLRFLGLLKGDDIQPELERIVRAKDNERKTLLADTIRKAYLTIDFKQLERATPSMLKEWLSKYNLEGSTERKVESFFINACKTYDIPLANVLKKKARKKPSKSITGTTRERRVGKEKKATTETDLKIDKPRQFLEEPSEQVFRIFLNDGYELKLCLNTGIFNLKKEDRTYVLDMVDRMREYNK